MRDPERRKSATSLEHTVVTTGTSIIERLPTYGLRLEHEDGYRCQMNFVEDGTRPAALRPRGSPSMLPL